MPELIAVKAADSVAYEPAPGLTVTFCAKLDDAKSVSPTNVRKAVAVFERQLGVVVFISEYECRLAIADGRVLGKGEKEEAVEVEPLRRNEVFIG